MKKLLIMLAIFRRCDAIVIAQVVNHLGYRVPSEMKWLVVFPVALFMRSPK